MNKLISEGRAICFEWKQLNSGLSFQFFSNFGMLNQCRYLLLISVGKSFNFLINSVARVIWRTLYKTHAMACIHLSATSLRNRSCNIALSGCLIILWVIACLSFHHFMGSQSMNSFICRRIWWTSVVHERTCHCFLYFKNRSQIRKTTLNFNCIHWCF